MFTALVVDDFTPSTMISVSYPSKKEVTLGNTLSPDETQDKPHIQITPEPSEESSTYTVVSIPFNLITPVLTKVQLQVLTDPDAPSRDDPKWSEFCHWISTDYKSPSIEAIATAESFEAASVKGGKDVVEYMGPAPPKGIASRSSLEMYIN